MTCKAVYIISILAPLSILMAVFCVGVGSMSINGSMISSFIYCKSKNERFLKYLVYRDIHGAIFDSNQGSSRDIIFCSCSCDFVQVDEIISALQKDGKPYLLVTSRNFSYLCPSYNTAYLDGYSIRAICSGKVIHVKS